LQNFFKNEEYMRILVARDIERIKEELWAGNKQRDIAADYGVTQTTISRIMTGHEYYDTAWPDSSIGPLSITRRKEIHTGRRSRASERVLSVMENLTSSKAEKAIRTAVEEEPEPAFEEVADAVELAVETIPQSAEAAKEPEPRITKEEAYSVLEEKADELEAQDQEDMKATLAAVGDSPPESISDGTVLELELESITWKSVLLLAGGNPFVKKAEDEDNLILQQAIGVVFKALPAWESDQCATLLKSTYDVLMEEQDD
jgi:acyl-CoA reductase-like NAD-dependent aldehyde dehydrogenase